jgi:transcriptional regulator with XRE-family HTH domain
MHNTDIASKILSTDDFLVDDFNPNVIMSGIAERVKRNRLELNLTQKAFASKSGLSLGSLKRFEHTGEISLKGLVIIAVAIGATEEFSFLFRRKQYRSIDELLKIKKALARDRKRGRLND